MLRFELHRREKAPLVRKSSSLFKRAPRVKETKFNAAAAARAKKLELEEANAAMMDASVTSGASDSTEVRHASNTYPRLTTMHSRSQARPSRTLLQKDKSYLLMMRSLTFVSCSSTLLVPLA